MSSFTYNKAIGGSLHKYGARILLAFGTRMGTTAQTVSYPPSLVFLITINLSSCVDIKKNHEDAMFMFQFN
jgi:hypothetical protein